ncbi:YceD family protein, partial [Kaarinaea lacus]
MLSRLPEFIDPMAMVEKRQVLEGILPLSKMRRLAPMLSDAHGDVRVSMQFRRGQNRQAEVAGKVTTELKLTCQRCMETMSLPLELSFHLGIVFSLSEAEKLPEQYEPLVVDSDTDVSVVEMIEDELLLAMPAV